MTLQYRNWHSRSPAALIAAGVCVLLLLQLLSFAGASATHAAMSAHGMPASVQGGAGCAGADCGDMMMTAAAPDCCHAGVVSYNFV